MKGIGAFMEMEDGSNYGSKNGCLQEDGRNNFFFFDFFSGDNGVELANPVRETQTLFHGCGASKPEFGPFFFDLDLSLKLANSVSAPLGLAPCVGNKIEEAEFELYQSAQFECINHGAEIDVLEGLQDPEAQQLQRFARKETDDVSRDASQSTPIAATSCTESSVCDNFGGEILTERVETTTEDMHEISWYGSAEQDALSRAGDMKSGKETARAGLTVNGRKCCKQRVNVNSGALDLLVSAIQATSGNDHHMEKQETDIHNLLSFVHKKRVLRRARSKFNKFSIKKKMGIEGKLKLVEQIAGLEAKSKVKGVLEDGETVIRSRRGRCLTLPTKFSDSVIHLWNRKTRRAI